MRTLRLWFVLLCGAGSALANTYTVTTTADSGAGSLRQAILDANGNPGADTVSFNITGSGVQTITPSTALPAITSPVTIDGFSQPGSMANTNPTGQGLNAVLLIELVGYLSVSASDTTIRGLVIHGTGSSTFVGITISNGTSNNKVEGCFIGTDAAGLTRIDQGFSVQVSAVGGSGHTIGGSAPAARNLLAACQEAVSVTGAASGNTIEGNLMGLTAAGDALLTPACNSTTYTISLTGTGHTVRNNVVAGGSNGLNVSGSGDTFLGNFIGTDVTGTVPFGPDEHGFAVDGTNHVIGGTGPEDGNIVAGAGFYNGLELSGSGHIVYGNFIGTDRTGTIDLGNLHAGIVGIGSDLTIGGTSPGQGNTIAFNSKSGYSGVLVQGQGVRIRGNRIYANTGLGIDLYVGLTTGVTAERSRRRRYGARTAPRTFQFSLTAGPAAPLGSGTHITGVLNSTASTTFDIDFYSNPACAPRAQEYLEGQDYIGSTQVTTDGSGNTSFDVTLPFTVEPGARITATATDPSGNTSEFSQRLVFSMTPASGPPAGGTSLTVNGMLFADGATVTIGGAPAGGVTVVNPAKITASAPSLAAGTLNDVVVANTDGTGGTLVNGWVADFNDVPGSQQFYFYVTKLVANEITVGVGGGNYGVGQPTLRQQMAVFLLKSKYGLCYAPPPCTTQIFTDVPCSLGFAPWINELVAEGITGGCGDGTAYCPTNPVLRQQMAVLLLRTFEGASYTPPACVTATFSDVPCTSNFAPWIYELVARNVTGWLRRRQVLPHRHRQSRPDGDVRRQDLQPSLGSIPAAAGSPTIAARSRAVIPITARRLCPRDDSAV